MLNLSYAAVLLLLNLAHCGNEVAQSYFEAFEETCLGWDGPQARTEAENAGVCAYFEWETRQ